jgi:hypothetical protein
MNLSEIIASTRENTILAAYASAVLEVKHLVENNPFVTTHTITAGCTSKQMCHEIARRFNQGGVKSIAISSNGLVNSAWSILITCPLAGYLTEE